MHEADRILVDQSGLISRRQALGAGLTTSDIARKIRRHEWAMVHPGVFVGHTGPLTWQQRAWAAVLYSWPAALCHESAIRAAEGPGRRDRDDAVIHVAVARSRHLVAPPGVRLHRSTGLLENVRWNLGPPRVRYEDAVLDAAVDAPSDLRSVAILADACGSRRTTALRLLEVAGSRARLSRRTWLVGVLNDVATGTCSVLEHGYLTRVERPHGLPRGERQVSHRHEGTQVFRDVEYRKAGVVVELDGRIFHSSAERRDADMDRDLDAASEGRETLRVSYGQVFDRACRTAGRVGAVLTRRGWAGTPHACAECG
ncbi:MAG TPA: hypothetical protein VGP00_01880 [Nocardioides sp.]|nr:hypothetical protein [Nocardioides sp.]